MSNVSMSEVHDMADSFSSSAASLKESLASFKNNANSIAGLQSFEGTGAAAVKGYLKDIHVETSSNYNDLLSSMGKKMKMSIELFHSTVDNDHSCIIKSEYVTQLQNEIKDAKDKVKDAVKSINSEISKISDISSASKIDASNLNNDYNQFKKITKEVLKNLSEFTSATSGQTAELENNLSLLHQIQSGMSEISSSAEGILSYLGDNSFIKALIRSYKDLQFPIDNFLEPSSNVAKELKKFLKMYMNGNFDYKNGHIIVRGTRSQLEAFMGKIPNSTYKKMLRNAFVNGKFVGIKSKFNFKDGFGAFIRSSGIDDSLNSIKREAFQSVKNISKLDWNDVKTVGSSVKKSVKSSLLPFADFKGASKLTKGMGILSAVSIGATGLDKYDSAKKSGLNGISAGVATVTNTTVETASDTAIVSGLTSFGTAICPGIGTAVGFGLGLAVTWAKDNVKLGDKTLNEHVTSAVNNTVKGVSDKLKGIGNWLSGKK